MSRLAGIGFALFVAFAAAYAFAPRQGPAFPATVARVETLLLLDGETAGARLVIVGEHGAVFVSDDDGAHWQAANAPSRTALTSVFFFDGRRGWAVGHDSLIIRTEDGGANWLLVYSAPDEQKPLFDVWFSDGSRGFAVGAYGSFLQTADGGKSWQPRKIIDDDKHLNALARGLDGTLFIAGEAGTLLRSADGGETWEALAAPYRGSFFGVLGAADGGIVAFGMRGQIFRSQGNGDTWAAVASGSQANLLGGRVLSDGTLILVGQEGIILASRDHGRTFALQKTGTSDAHNAMLVTAAGDWLLLGERGVTRYAPAVK